MKLFRGKTKSGEWVYGDLLYPMRMYVFTSKNLSKDFCLIVETSFAHGGRVSVGRKHWVKRDTVGQYTGVKDINGKYVYELDKVKMHYFFRNAYAPDYGVFEDEDEIVGIVRIDEFGTYTECNGEKWYWFTYVGEPETQLEVIGTIHD